MVDAKITEIKWDEKKIGLSIRALIAPEAPAAEESAAEEASVEETAPVEEASEEATEE